MSLFYMATRAIKTRFKEIQFMELKDTVIEQETQSTQEEEAKSSRTFTQDEVNTMIGERLAKERKKYSDYEAIKDKATRFDALGDYQATLKSKDDKIVALQNEVDALNKGNEIRTIREKVSSETGVPISLLTADTEDAMKAQADAIIAFAKPKYPNVKDSGEFNGAQKASVEEQFAEWFNQSLK